MPDRAHHAAVLGRGREPPALSSRRPSSPLVIGETANHCFRLLCISEGYQEGGSCGQTKVRSQAISQGHQACKQNKRRREAWPGASLRQEGSRLKHQNK